MAAGKEPKPLEPIDPKRCQAEVPNGTSFMTFGGDIGGRVRCSNKPSYVAIEREPDKYGRYGLMSICEECHPQFLAHGLKEKTFLYKLEE